MQGDFVTYLVRSLLSEGRIDYETVEKGQDGKHVARVISRKGPTGLIVTTTEIDLHPENETRLLSLQMNDSKEQTGAILEAIAAGDTGFVDFGPWHALQNWIHEGERRVEVPFASAVNKKVPPVAVRLRRDFSTVLTLVKAHAILHQATRERDPEGRIVADLDDYAVVRELVLDLISEGVQATVSRAIRETVKAVALLQQQSGPITAAAVSKQLNLDPSAGNRRVWGALNRGYLRNEAPPKRPMKLVLGEPMPEDVEVLPSVETVRAQWNDCTIAPITEGKSTPPPSSQQSKPEGGGAFTSLKSRAIVQSPEEETERERVII
jgi:hypothetical protein